MASKRIGLGQNVGGWRIFCQKQTGKARRNFSGFVFNAAGVQYGLSRAGPDPGGFPAPSAP